MSNDSTRLSDRDDASAKTRLLIVIGLVSVTLLLYGRVWEYEFVNFDDDVHVYQNPYVVGGLTWTNVVWAFGIHGPSQWHPLAWLSHQLDCELFGLWAGGHHLTNLVLHVGTVVLLFLVLFRLTSRTWPSAFVAAVFAVHPLNVESVAWVSERRNVLCMFLAVVTIGAYSAYVRRGGVFRYSLVVVAYALGLMAKPMLVTLPCVLLLLDYWPLRRFAGPFVENAAPGGVDLQVSSTIPLRRLWFLLFEKLPLLLCAAVSSVLTIWCQEGVVATTTALPIGVRVLNSLAAYGIYLRKLFWPSDLAVFYPHPGFVDVDPMSVLRTAAIVGGVVLAGMTVFALTRMRRKPYLAVGWFWFVGTLVPMIGLVQVGEQQLADRYLYLPVVGLLMAIAWWVPSWFVADGRRSSTAGFFGVLAVIGCGLISWNQIGYWHDSVTLFERALAVTERNSWAHNNLGLALHHQGNSGDAALHFQQALLIDPQYALAQYNLGVVLQDLGRSEQAIPHFAAAVALSPEYVDAHLRLGAAFATLGRLDAAVTHFRQAVELAPDQASAQLNLGIALGRQQLHSEAVAHLRRAAALSPNDSKMQYALAIGLHESGDLSAAERQFHRVVEQDPDLAAGHMGLGQVLLESGRRDEAAASFREASRLEPNNREAARKLKQAVAE